ncbi:sodium-dependent transporter [Halegenticoccus tardaugens]|uniref:sodium-dependent transporter n=1 Tax=Halegenticoccus tardaugens TaxID=2071624 RepID=UPI00100BC486|nr:sodium-dependent transporter [Halegenticoccus tardaugens]
MARETWATRVGFVLAAVGSAVGLGNIWQFPFKTAEFGGATFLVVYLVAALSVGLPAILAEFVVGRRSKRNVVDAFGALGHPGWTLVGVVGLFSGFWILSYYSVVGGWVLRYVAGSATGAYFGDPAAYFAGIAAGTDALALHGAFMAIVVGVVALGVEDGIERATKLMVPSIVVVLLALALWAVTLPGAGAGYAYYLAPDLDELFANLGELVPYAVGQAFFSLSLGMGAMITYASYLDGDDSLARDGLAVVLFNTSVGVLAGFVVFPLLFAQGVSPDQSGPGAVFVGLATAFSELPAGRLLGVAFFVVVLVAALSSAISLLEVAVSYVIDNHDAGRAPTALGLGASIFLLGVPSSLDLAWFEWFDALTYNLYLPLSVLLVLAFVGWVLGGDALDEVRKGTSGDGFAALAWLWTVRVVVLLAVVGTLALGLQSLVLDGAIAPPF